MSTNNNHLRRYEDKLLEQQRTIERSMLTAVEQGRETTVTETQDPADQAVLAYQKEFLFSQGTKGAAQLSLVRLALDRIKDGSFGECIHCGSTIGTKRLEALPWTPHCIECQEKIETGELDTPVRAA